MAMKLCSLHNLEALEGILMHTGINQIELGLGSPIFLFALHLTWEPVRRLSNTLLHTQGHYYPVDVIRCLNSLHSFNVIMVLCNR